MADLDLDAIRARWSAAHHDESLVRSLDEGEVRARLADAIADIDQLLKIADVTARLQADLAAEREANATLLRIEREMAEAARKTVERLEGENAVLRRERDEALGDRQKPSARELLAHGGEWLGAARSWLQWHARNGSDVTWGSRDALEKTFTVAEIEDLAATVAAAAMAPQPDEKRLANALRARWTAERERDEMRRERDEAVGRAERERTALQSIANGNACDPKETARWALERDAIECECGAWVMVGDACATCLAGEVRSLRASVRAADDARNYAIRDEHLAVQARNEMARELTSLRTRAEREREEMRALLTESFQFVEEIEGGWPNDTVAELRVTMPDGKRAYARVAAIDLRKRIEAALADRIAKEGE